MNNDLFNLSQLPQRSLKPRADGLTMVMDKGLSMTEAESMVEVGHPHIDLLKLGFGTAVVTPNVIEKIKMYQKAGLAVYFGGTLFEAYVIRNQFDDYLRLIEKTGIQHAEV